MHCIQLADLAATISISQRSLLHRNDELSADAMTRYWTATRSRLDLWNRVMVRHRHTHSGGDAVAMRRWWVHHRVVLEDIFVSEILSRVVAAMANELETGSQPPQWSPVTDMVLASHLEISNRVQTLMLVRRGHSVEDAVRLNRLRRSVARWSDVWVSDWCRPDSTSLRYAADPIRAAEFARERWEAGKRSNNRVGGLLARAAMLDSLRSRCDDRTALPAATAAVATAVMGTLRPVCFDSAGTLADWIAPEDIDLEMPF